MSDDDFRIVKISTYCADLAVITILIGTAAILADIAWAYYNL